MNCNRDGARHHTGCDCHEAARRQELATRDTRIAELEAERDALLRRDKTAGEQHDLVSNLLRQANAKLTTSKSQCAALQESWAMAEAKSDAEIAALKGELVAASAALLQRLEQTERERGWALEVARKYVPKCWVCKAAGTKEVCRCDVHCVEGTPDAECADAIRALGPLLALRSDGVDSDGKH
jgi:hypothetical protein